jgi:CRP-like cAMP-binding protein
LTRLENHLLSRLPAEGSDRLAAMCERCSLVVDQVLSEVDQPALDVYFPLGAIASVVARTAESDSLGLALIGCEGMLGSELALGILSHPIGVIVQGAGDALRISVAALQHELLKNFELQARMRIYVDVLMRQFSRSASCSHFHEIGPRLARWLLMSQDRSRSTSFHITHEFLGHMLGVRRVGVTAAAFDLQREGLIQYHRGDLIILNRAGLKTAACSCYASDLKAWSYKRAAERQKAPGEA